MGLGSNVQPFFGNTKISYLFHSTFLTPAVRMAEIGDYYND